MTEIATPAAMDALIHDHSVDLQAWLEAQEEGPLKEVRALQVAIALNDQMEIQRRIPLLPDHPLTPGMRSMAWAALLVWEPILAHPFAPEGCSPLELEGHTHGYTARGIAQAETGDFEGAVVSVKIAETFAVALGMKNRAQMLGLELDRVMTLSGRPSPEQTQARLYQPMPELRRQWGQRNLAESHMALGCYQQALRALGPQGMDGVEDAALREYLHTVLRLPPARESDDPLIDPEAAYNRLAVAGRDVAAHQRVCNLEGIVGEPQATYARLMKAATLYTTPGMAQQAVDLLESVKTFQPDQRYFRDIFLLSCRAVGAQVQDAHHLVSRINAAIDALRPEADILSVVHRFAPEATTLLILAGSEVGTHPRLLNLDLLRVPLLAGHVVRYAGREYPVSGKVGRILVLEAMSIAQQNPFPQELKRMREALEGIPERRVNLGWVAQGCIQMRRACRRAHEPVQSLAWKAAYARVWAMMTEDVQKELQALPDYQPETLR